MIEDVYDIAVVGAGPAGLAAASLAAEKGASVVLFDEQHSPGGQIYRAIERNVEANPNRPELGQSYFKGAAQARRFRASGATYVTGAMVWQVSQEGEICYSHDGEAATVQARHVVIATGAMERPVPIPGWTRAGVMSMGAAQILLKQSSLGFENAVFVGTGPLFYLVLTQYLDAGLPIRAAIDLTPPGNYRRALRYVPAAARAPGKLLQGLTWQYRLRRAGFPLIRGARDIAITGEDDLADGVIYRDAAGRQQRIDAEHVLLHQGVIPNVNLSMAIGCNARWDDLQACWTIEVDDWFQSSQNRVSVVGDGATIAGAEAAEVSGQIATLGVLARLSRLSESDRDRLARPMRRALEDHRRLRPFLDALYRPPVATRVPSDDDTVVCRCEEVTVGAIRSASRHGCPGPNQLKSFTRCGMGPCQGRMCGTTVSEVLARESGKTVADTGYYRIRPPIKPIPLVEIASLSPIKEET